MCKKIIIFGFPHSGTTILRNIIGHIKNVYDIVDEIKNIDDNVCYENYEYVLCKYPYLINENLLLTKYSDYIKIFIIRNPLYVFSSLNKRFKDEKLDVNHNVAKYIETITQFNYFKNEKKINNLFLIRYEDMFENKFEKLKNMFNDIGFTYNDDIFDNSKYVNKVQHCNNLKIPKTKPTEKEHAKYRLFQVNQKFENNNDVNKIFLTDEQYKILTSNENILNIYPDINQTNVF
jgi:hypothetical protein